MVAFSRYQHRTETLTAWASPVHDREVLLTRISQHLPRCTQVAPQAPRGSDLGAGKGLAPVFIPCVENASPRKCAKQLY